MATQTGTLKAGNQLVIDSQGAPVDYDVSVTGYAVYFKRIQQENTLSIGPYKVDCSYSVTVNYGSPSIYKVQPNGQREYTADTLPDPATLGVGASVVVGGDLAISGGDYYRQMSRRTINNPVKTLRPFGKVATVAGLLGYTSRMVLLSPVPFYAIRVKFVNCVTSAIVGSKAAFATPDNNSTPCVTDAPFTPITVGGLSTFSEGAAATATESKFTLSDIIPVTPVKRTDGDGYILIISKYTPSAGNTAASRAENLDDLPEITDQLSGNFIQVGAWQGDAIANPSSFVRTVTTISHAMYVELFTGDGIVRTMLYSGDSITQGQGGSSNAGSFQYGAAKRLCAERGIIPLCGAIAGAKSVDYVPQGLKYIDEAAPTYAVVAPWSINDLDAVTAGVEKRILSNMVQWLAACYQYNSKPGFITPAPKNGLTLAEEAVRRTVVETIKEFCTANAVMCIDRDAAMTDYTVATGGYKAGLFADALHPNYAGYSAELPYWEELIL